MPRKEEKWMNGWKFALVREPGEMKKPEIDQFHSVILPHDWAISCPFSKEMDEAASQGYRDRFGVGWYEKHGKWRKKRRDISIFSNSEGYLRIVPYGSMENWQVEENTVIVRLLWTLHRIYKWVKTIFAFG